MNDTPPPAGRDDEHQVVLALADATAAFTAGEPLPVVLDRILEAALWVVAADAGSIMLLTHLDVLEVVAARGPRAAQIVGFRQPADRSVAGWALRAGRALLLHGRDEQGSWSDHPRDLSSAVVVPLAVTGRVVGVLNASRESGAAPMDEENARLLALLANHAAIVIDHARVVADVQRRDELTTPREAPREAEPSSREAPRLAAPLTPRERDVLSLLVDGLTNREIAAHLTVEPDTVKDHVQMIIKKLHAADRTHAAVLAVRYGLVV